MDLPQILRTVLAEHEDSGTSGTTLETLQADVEARLSDISSIPAYSESSKQLSIVSFRCMLQDTGYPPEVYLPATENAQDGAIDMSQLKERWVGWAVEVPGEQIWAKGETNSSVDGASGDKKQLPKEVHGKYPLPGVEGKSNYLGALVKVYDEDATFRPATVHTMIGVLSTASLPSATHPGEDEGEVIVPTIHIIKIESQPAPVPLDVPNVPEGLIDYLSTAFNDRLAGELLLLSLLSSPSVRPNALPPLGTLSLNFLRKNSQITGQISQIISSISPQLINLPLSIPILHSHPFNPTSTDSTLESGLLQLAPGSVLLVNEDEMGQGGQLQEKAIKNLQALVECVKDQMVRYEYPYMDGLKMECSIKVIMLSEGKSLIPVDINLPVIPDGPSLEISTPDLETFRAYLASRSSPSHANKFNIPDSVAQAIQDDFVSRRKDSNTAEEGLKRRMRLARLMAIATASGTLSEEVWARTLDLDERIEARLDHAQK